MVDEAYGTALPSVSVTGSYINNLKIPVMFMPAQIIDPKATGFVPVEFSAENQFQAQAQLTQILFNSAVFTAIGSSKIYVDISKEQYNATILKTATDVEKAFYAAALTKKPLLSLQILLKWRRQLRGSKKIICGRFCSRI